MDEPRSREELLRDLEDGRPIPWNRELAASEEPEDAAFRRALNIIERVASVGDASPMEQSVPFRHWSHLRLERKIAAGSHGEVFLAHDLGLDMDVALKLFRTGAEEFPTRDRLLDEARHLARIRHPGVAGVLGADIDHDRLGFWMELVPGRNLRQVMEEEGPLAAGRVAEIGAAIAQALTSIHAAGFVHQDLKPENVVQTETGRIVLVDLGASLERDRTPSDGVRGTPLYAAPEVLAGEVPSVASDAYALGVLLHFLLCGRHPYEGGDLDALRDAHRRGARRILRAESPATPTRLNDIVEQLLVRDPAARRSDLGRIALELDAIAAPRRRRGIGPALLVLAVAVLCLAVVESVRRSGRPVAVSGPPLVAFTDLVPRTPADSTLAQSLSTAIRTRLERADGVSLVGPQVHAAYVRDPVRAGALLYGAVDRRRPLHVLTGEAGGSSVSGRSPWVRWSIRSWPTGRVRARGVSDAARIGTLGSLVAMDALGALGAASSVPTGDARPPELEDEVWIAFGRAVRAYESERGPQARALLERVLHLAPDFAEAHFLILFTLGADAPAVQEHLQPAWRNRDQLSLKHRILLEAQFAFARADLQEMHRVQREVLARWPDDADAFQAMVGVAMREGRVHQALQHLEKLLLLDPERLIPRAWYTSIVGNLRGVRAGLDAAEEFVRLHPHTNLAWLSSSVARQRAGDREGARIALRRALELDDDDLGLREQWALLTLNDGDTPSALAELGRLAPRGPKGPISTDFLRVRILHETGRTAASIAILDSLFRATAIPTLVIVEAMLLNEIGRHADARTAVERAMEVVSQQGKSQFYRHDLLLERGLARIGTDSAGAAVEDLRLLRELGAGFGPHSPARSNAHTLAARLAMDQGDYSTARAFLDSIALDHSPYAHSTLGAHRERELRWKARCFEEVGQLTLASTLLESDLVRTRHRPRIHFDRARVAWAMGDTATARVHLDEAFVRFAHAEPEHPEAIALRELAEAMGRPAPR